MDDLGEYLSGTVPTDGTNVLRITSFTLGSDAQTVQLACPSLLQRYYQVQRTADLFHPEWMGFTNAVFGAGTALPLGHRFKMQR